MRSIFALGAAIVACGGSTPPPAGPSPSDSAETESLNTTPPTTAASAPADPTPPRAPRPLDLTNSCARAMRLYYGENPGDGAGQFANVDAGATIPVPRGADGSVVVWVVTDKGLGLATVHVTKRMKHVAIDSSCMKIDAS